VIFSPSSQQLAKRTTGPGPRRRTNRLSLSQKDPLCWRSAGSRVTNSAPLWARRGRFKSSGTGFHLHVVDRSSARISADRTIACQHRWRPYSADHGSEYGGRFSDPLSVGQLTQKPYLCWACDRGLSPVRAPAAKGLSTAAGSSRSPSVAMQGNSRVEARKLPDSMQTIRQEAGSEFGT